MQKFPYYNKRCGISLLSDHTCFKESFVKSHQNWLLYYEFIMAISLILEIKLASGQISPKYNTLLNKKNKA